MASPDDEATVPSDEDGRPVVDVSTPEAATKLMDALPDSWAKLERARDDIAAGRTVPLAEIVRRKSPGGA